MTPIDLVSSRIQELGKQLGIYFILVNLLPTIILIFIIYLAITLGPFVIYDDNNNNSFENKLFVNDNNNLNFTYVNEKVIEFGEEENIVSIIFGIIILSIIMIPLQLIIIRLFEGYWPKIFYPFTVIGQKIQKYKFANIQNEEDKKLKKIDKEDSEMIKEIISKCQLKRILYYPDYKRILPTGL